MVYRLSRGNRRSFAASYYSPPSYPRMPWVGVVEYQKVRGAPAPGAPPVPTPLHTIHHTRTYGVHAHTTSMPSDALAFHEPSCILLICSILFTCVYRNLYHWRSCTGSFSLICTYCYPYSTREHEAEQLTQ